MKKTFRPLHLNKLMKPVTPAWKKKERDVLEQVECPYCNKINEIILKESFVMSGPVPFPKPFIKAKVKNKQSNKRTFKCDYCSEIFEIEEHYDNWDIKIRDIIRNE